jgi:hypothetical protein
MSLSLPLFCDVAFQEELKQYCPTCQIFPFVTDVRECSSQIDALEGTDSNQVVLLYKAPQGSVENLAVKDHINLSHENPLIGPADLDKGPRFPDMSSVYEKPEDGVIVVMGEDSQLNSFTEPWVAVNYGVWEAIALKHRGVKIHAWLIADLQKWVREQSILH